MSPKAQQARLIELINANRRLMQVMRFAQALDLPNWLLVSGCIYQTVWNAQTGRAPEYGLKDYDLAYFDADRSWTAEDHVIRRAAAQAPADLAPLIEVRNQARVHLWFEGKFGEPYTELSATEEMLERFVCPAFAIGAKLAEGDQLVVYAPFGLEDCFAMRLRPNPLRPSNPLGFARVLSACRARWPELTIHDDDAPAAANLKSSED